MEFTFRLTGLRPSQTLRLSDDALEVLDETGQRQQSIPWREIRKLQEYDGLPVTDPQSGRFPSRFFRVFAAGGTVDFRNGYHLHSVGKLGEAATDLTAEYEVFTLALMNRLAAVKPSTAVTSGWMLASLCWWALAALGVGCLAFAVMAYFYDPFLTALGLTLFFLPVGLMLIYAGSTFGRAYWPKRTTVSARVARNRIEGG